MSGGVRRALFGLGWFAAAAYVLAGVVGGVWSRWDEASASDQIVWVVLLVGGGLMLAIGLRRFETSPWVGTALVSVGALAGALVLLWTLLVPLIAIALVVLGVVHARRLAAADDVHMPAAAS
jgi:di/tricarboxylate transporter